MKNFLRWLGVGVLFLTAEVMALPPPGGEKIRAEKGAGKKEDRIEQKHQRREKWQRKRMKRLTEELNLTEEQQKQVSAIFKEGKVKIEAERKTFREKIQQIRKDTDKEIEKLLNGKQLKKWKEHKEKIREKAKKRRGKRKERRGGRKEHFGDDD